jgi:hypothetical protein
LHRDHLMTTANRGYQKPDPDRSMLDDCVRLQNALDAIDTDVGNLISSATSAHSNTQASAMLAIIKTVDGAGSGLNADRLDGLDSTDLAPAAHVGAGGTQHSGATQASAGFMTTAQVTKLDGIGSGANVTSVAGKTGVVTLVAADASAAPSTHVGAGGTEHSSATTTSAGFMATTHVVDLNLVKAMRAGRAFFMRG